MDEEGSVNDGRLGRCLARCVSRNYVSFCKTATIQVAQSPLPSLLSRIDIYLWENGLVSHVFTAA